MQNKKRILIIVSSILILITIIGLSYAYFAANIIGNEEVSSIAGRAAYLEVTFADGEDTITGNNIIPGWSASKSFTVTNTGENKTYYNLKVINITNTFAIPGSISLSISSTDGGKNVEKMVLPASDEVIARSIPIELNGVHHYTVTAYYNNLDVDQIDDLNKTFSFDITIENATKPEPQGWSTAPEGSLLAGIKKNNNEPGGLWTVPGRQGSTHITGWIYIIPVSTAQSGYYWTYGDGYIISSRKFNLTNPSICVYSSCYNDLVGKYLISASADDNAESTATMKTTDGWSYTYHVLSATPTQLIVEKYSYLERGTSSSYKYWTYGTWVEPASTNNIARYNLIGTDVINYDEHYEELVGKYLASSSNTTLTLSYISSSAQNLKKTTNNVGYVYKIVDTKPNYIIYTGAREGTFGETEDDYGTSYYYRGEADNNYLVFANMCWRIVRIDGQGNTKITLYNYNPTNSATPCDASLDAAGAAFARYDNTTNGQNGKSKFNTNYNKNTYVGYMYSNNPDSTDYNIAHANDNDSTILTNLKAWYDLVFSQTDKDILADTIWCNDKRVVTDTTYDPWNWGNILGTGLGKDKTYYQGAKRLNPSSSAVPSLKCGETSEDNKISKYTASDKANGNGALTFDNKEYKIGLLTADEIAFAGATSSNANKVYYLYKNANDGSNWYWSLSPRDFDGFGAFVWRVREDGSLGYGPVHSNIGVRPAVSLKSTASITSGGNGTQSNPFVVN